MSKRATAPSDADVDMIAISHLADMITTITGRDDHDAVATQATQLFRTSQSAQYAALCYSSGSVPDEKFRAVVTREMAR